MNNWLYPLLALGILASLFVFAYLYVRWKDMKAMREFARRYRAERDREGFPGYRKADQPYSPTDSVDSPQPHE